MKKQILLALDIGTSSTRAVAYDAHTAEAIPGAVYAIDHQPEATPDGGSTLSPDALVSEVIRCLGETLDRAGSSCEPLGVGMSCFWHSFVGVDEAGEPHTPVLVWADRRSAPQVTRLRHTIDVAAYTDTTGCQLHTSYALGRLLWLQETQPDIWRRCHRFLSPAEYIFSRLFGLERTTCSLCMASGTGLCQEKAGIWDLPTLALVPGLTVDHLSPIHDAPVRGIRSPYRERLPRLADLPWFPGLGDGACSNIGCGATRPGTIALMIGTSGALRAVVPAAPAVAPGLWRYLIDSDRWLVGGALSNGGAVWAWLRATLNLPGLSDNALDNALGALTPDAHRLTVLPFLYGERAPLWRDDATAVIVGLQGSTTPLDIARAHMEAVAYRFAAVRDALRTVVPSGRVLGTGAALVKSAAWGQILADVLQEEIDVAAETQASARGAALWVREKLGLGAIEMAAPLPVIAQMQPDLPTRDIYTAARTRHEALLSMLIPDL